MSMILAATHDKYKVRELGASEVNPAEAAGGGGEVVDAVVGGGEVGGDGGGRRNVTSTGVARSVVVPSPSSPALLSPQHFAVPSVSTAQEWSYPRTTLEAVVMPDTVTGVERSVVVPSPS